MVKHEIKKITHYEYWSFWAFYFAMVPLWLWYSLKNKSFLYFLNTNPGIKYGGFFSYSKFKLQQQIPQNFRPKHQLISVEQLTKHPSHPPFDFPFIAKPDCGERGKGVTLINDLHEWECYTRQLTTDLIAQTYVEAPLEFGVFYARHPLEPVGKIISITGKTFLTYTGDGKTSLREFIESDARAYFNKSYLYMKFHEQLDFVLPKNEQWLLEEIGNHNRGTYFYDASELICPKLEQTIDQISQEIDGFYYGRMDIKSESINDFQNGIFNIIEVNGVNSEPTHIYDKKYKLLQAYREVARHLKVQEKIAHYLIKNGDKTMNIKIFTTDLIQYLKK